MSNEVGSLLSTNASLSIVVAPVITAQSPMPTNQVCIYGNYLTFAATVTAPGQFNGYMSWGSHSRLGDQFATNASVQWLGASRWWIIETVESYNGQRDNPYTSQSNFLEWFSANAFGGTNYANTPVGAVSHVEEPGLSGVSKAEIYFGLWGSGKCFGIAAWNSRATPFFQASGDPFTTR